MNNVEFAATLVQGLCDAGLRHVCISPGSRSGPLAIAFARNSAVRVWMHVDERSSGFFALGAAKRLGEPVAVLTTSGTAAAELHPAVLEAYYSLTPLVLLTADRPPELHDRGANQTVVQAGIFGGATRWSIDAGPPGPATTARATVQLAARAMATARGPAPGPVHINLPFREPLLEGAMHTAGSQRNPRGTRVHDINRETLSGEVGLLSQLLASAQRPLLHAGSLSGGPRLAAALRALTDRTGLVVHAEPTSQLRLPGIAGLLSNTEALLRDDTFAAAHAPDLVIRIGAAPTSRVLSEWLQRSAPEHVVLVDPEAVWRDPDALATDMLHCDIAALASGAAATTNGVNDRSWRDGWMAADAIATDAVQRRLAELPLFEAHVVQRLARATDGAATIVVGSSMAIRDVDWFWPAAAEQRFIANRGASGIDGFASTALGAAAVSAGEPVIALCGDLTLYHDMNGLLAARKHGLAVTFVVLNNDGGGIFSFLRESEHEDVFEETFATPTGLELRHVAALYDLEYRSVTGVPELATALAQPPLSKSAIVDVRFSRADSVSGHRALWAAASSAIHEAHPAMQGT
ncbi:MAG TPA: 2-succinyl-5-enolpyruvyl-6-hydroxy-3-cyclohexene-1-carboxylic-acid synthase [Candidatus Dormibacteraeota bacterium]|nr:2-succinyl-5-enolpyruvyl-6-hydroxy-3-cyclohexene-1-carboxylic-acid synthase [Candidatus Dormibacteraeota bacterium]